MLGYFILSLALPLWAGGQYAIIRLRRDCDCLHCAARKADQS